MTGSPKLGASPSRTLRGITVSKTSDGKCSRTSRSTSWASFVRASCMVNSMPATVRRGLSSRCTSDSVSSRPASPSSAKYSVCTGTITRSAATSALIVSGPSDGGVHLRVDVNDEGVVAGRGDARGDVDGGGGLPDPALLVRDGVDGHLRTDASDGFGGSGRKRQLRLPDLPRGVSSSG